MSRDKVRGYPASTKKNLPFSVTHFPYLLYAIYTFYFFHLPCSFLWPLFYINTNLLWLGSSQTQAHIGTYMWTHRGLYAWRNTWICPIQVLSMPTLAFTKPPSNLGKHHFIKKLNFVPRFREKLGWRWVLRKSHSVFKENCTSEETSSQTQTSIAYDQQEWETEGRQGKCLKPFFWHEV